MAPAGNLYSGDEAWMLRYSMPPAGSGGIKTSKTIQEKAGDVKTSTAPGANGEGNIAGAGTPYMPELAIILGGELV